MSSADRLLSRERVHTVLYDVESMMDVKESIAQGYVVLLNGRPPPPRSSSKKKRKSKNKQDDENLNLAFMALTSGNVIDSCFGVVTSSMRGDTPAQRSVREAKTLLEECDVNDAFRRTAVDAYCEAFVLVIRYHTEMKKLNCFTRCFRAKSIRRDTIDDIRTAFSSLVMAIGDAE